jgi:hypothetical protein
MMERREKQNVKLDFGVIPNLVSKNILRAKMRRGYISITSESSSPNSSPSFSRVAGSRIVLCMLEIYFTECVVFILAPPALKLWRGKRGESEAGN